MGTQTDSAANAAERRTARWISCGFEELARRYAGRRPGRPSFHFDLAIVGSGYGGAMAAAELAGRLDEDTGRPARVCVLERGSEYLPGMFPTNEADLPGHVRFSTSEDPQPRGVLEGLLDVRIGPDVSALVACGLGGGSLINAGVMAIPGADAWRPNTNTWPLNPADLPYQDAKRRLGALVDGQDNTILRNRRHDEVPLKYKALKELGGASCSAAPLSISMSEDSNAAGIQLKACIQCGDCATGCNHSAKNSLDENLLVEAYRRKARLYTGATVTHLAKLPRGGWALYVVHTDGALRRRAGAPFELRARRVILAAGTFGSTEILLRSASEQLRFSRRLGQRFSANGDALAVAYRQDERVNAVARESDDPEVEPKADPDPPDRRKGRQIGPTITGMIDRRDEPKARGTIEEFAIPGALRRLFAESFTLAHCLQNLAEPDCEIHRPGDPDPLAVDDGALDRTQVFGIMGHDGANGSLELIEPRGEHADVGDGAIRVRWPAIHEDSGSRLFEEQIEVLRDLVAGSKQGGQILPNPVWRPLPKALNPMLDVPKGPIMTVHPLGGCPMGGSVEQGVVDEFGRVFDAARPDQFHDRLAVLDGSVIPTSLGVNPALTITAIALRAVSRLRSEWRLSAVQAPPSVDLSSTRPRFATPQYAARTPTLVQIVERMSGPMTLRDAAGRKVQRIAELTMQFEPVELTRLIGPRAHAPGRHDGQLAAHTLRLQPQQGRLRTFTPERWAQLSHYDPSEARYESEATGIYPISGSLAVLDREHSTARRRKWRAVWAWMVNRGLRDGYQALSDRSKPRDKGLLDSVCDYFKLLMGLATRAGEVRRLDYALEVGASIKQDPAIEAAATRAIRGHKRFTYARKCNPWNQLQQLFVTEFPGACFAPGQPARFDLNLKFLAGRSVPLFQLTQQDNHATALFDIASFLAYFARLMLSIHAWSLRKPDSEKKPAAPDRLPRRTPGLPRAEIAELDVGRHTDGTIASVRLTRFPRRDSTHNPLIMIHGYSASGTTFAHPAVKPNLASYMWPRGRDVWILDLRTSSGMPTASVPWTFEEVAHEDIPAALSHIVQVVRGEREMLAKCRGEDPAGAGVQLVKLDVIAHCMGSAMMTMAILGRPDPGAKYFAQREQLPSLIDRLILSQVAPTTVFSPANVFRAYAMGYLRQLLPIDGYQFHPLHEPTPMDQMLDRLLATLPYPEEEFGIENPLRPWKRTSWVRTRHRMDALYGRDFNLGNITPAILEHIDDLFGPLNMDTVLSAIHFARTSLITNRAGRNVFVKRQRLQEHWRNIKTLCVNGAENGLVDVATAYRLKHLMDDAKVNVFRTYIKEGYGHQDCLIGRNSMDVFREMERFLIDPEGYKSNPQIQQPGWVPRPRDSRVAVPWLGPVRGELTATRLRITIAPDPRIGTPTHFAIVPVFAKEGRYILRDGCPPQIMAWQGYGFGLTPIDVSLDRFECASDALLALFVYDEPAALDGANIEKAIVEYLTGTEIKVLAEGVICERPATRAKWHEPAKSADPDVTFAIGSCQYPPGPFDRDLASDSYSRLNKLLEHDGPGKPKFLVLMGDQIYSDATGGLFDPSISEDRYVLPYEKWLGTPAVRSVLRQLPTYMMLDDHEIEDNWEPCNGADPKHEEVLELGRTGYLTYQRTLGPPLIAKRHTARPLWYDATPEGLPFFFVDSRTDRQLRTLSHIQSAQMLSNDQLAELTEWISRKQREDASQPKFVVSSAMLLPRKIYYVDGEAGAFRADSWQGYPATFRQLLAHIADSVPRNLIFLSGDEHHSCVARIEVTNLTRKSETVVFHSVHCSGMYSPFPFANGKPQDLLQADTFRFNLADQQYRCDVTTRPIGLGDGFATIRCMRNGGSWSVRYCFYQDREQHRVSDELCGVGPSNSSPDRVTTQIAAPV